MSIRQPMHKKGLKFAPVVELAKLNFTYMYHSTKIAKARPGFEDWPEHPSVQINSSSPWCSAHWDENLNEGIIILFCTFVLTRYL